MYYKTMQDNEIPVYVWDDAKVLEKDEDNVQVINYRIDVLWTYLASVKDPQNM